MEKELRKAFEDVTTNNVKAAVDHSNETRRVLRELEAKVAILEGNALNQNDIIDSLKLQLSNVQRKVYQGGT